MTIRLGKDLCPAHRRWIRFQNTYRPCPECDRVHPDVWQARHPLLGRLRPYEAPETSSTFRTATWETLRYWVNLRLG